MKAVEFEKRTGKQCHSISKELAKQENMKTLNCGQKMPMCFRPLGLRNWPQTSHSISM
jgi:hypothetical protein